MAYTISEKVYIGGMIVIFCMILMGCVFFAYAASLWFRNRKEERKLRQSNQLAKAAARSEKERSEWSALLAVKDQEIASLQEQVSTLSRSVELTRKLLETSEAQRMKA